MRWEDMDSGRSGSGRSLPSPLLLYGSVDPLRWRTLTMCWVLLIDEQ